MNKNIFKEIINKQLNAFYWVGDYPYGNMLMQVEDNFYEISNFCKEEYSSFDIKELDLYTDFKPVDEGDIDVYAIRENILNINVIRDIIDVDNTDHLEFDMCIEITTDKHKYLLSRDYLYDEAINIDIDKDFNNIFTIVDQENNFNDDKNKYDVKVERVII